MVNSSTRRQLLSALAGTVPIALAGCSGGGNGDENDGGDDTETDSPTPTPTPTPTPVTVQVGPNAQNVFEPDSLEIPVGTTVTFVWESSGHSLLVDTQPDESGWEGVSETQSEGYEHSHTFQVPGSYEYYCDPHRGFGMEGTITVTE